jgi:hypothetical protein
MEFVHALENSSQTRLSQVILDLLGFFYLSSQLGYFGDEDHFLSNRQIPKINISVQK